MKKIKEEYELIRKEETVKFWEIFHRVPSEEELDEFIEDSRSNSPCVCGPVCDLRTIDELQEQNNFNRVDKEVLCRRSLSVVGIRER